MLTDQAGGRHTFTEHLACAPWGGKTKKWTIVPAQEVNYRLRLGRNFKIPEFLLPSGMEPDSGYIQLAVQTVGGQLKQYFK